MKKVLFILVAIIAFIAISCEKEEVAPPLWEWDYDGVLLGEWAVVSSVDNETFTPYAVDGESIFSFTDVDKWRAKGHTFAGTLIQGENVYLFEWYLKENSLMIFWVDDGKERANTEYNAEFLNINTTFVNDNEMNIGEVQLERQH